ncbi:MAG: hypothetical protein M3Y56_12715 [Armatimonadota bacterium]|nr:hypothetical protein [Armatimonadota bacterium]
MSGIPAGILHGQSLLLESLHPVRYPSMRPLTSTGSFVWGYEDLSLSFPAVKGRTMPRSIRR